MAASDPIELEALEELHEWSLRLAARTRGARSLRGWL